MRKAKVWKMKRASPTGYLINLSMEMWSEKAAQWSKKNNDRNANFDVIPGVGNDVRHPDGSIIDADKAIQSWKGQYPFQRGFSPMRTTEVGVAIFSLTRKNKVSTEKMAISTPDPAMEVKMPPMKPERSRAGIPMDPISALGRILLLSVWFRRNKAMANEPQIETNSIFLASGIKYWSIWKKPL